MRLPRDLTGAELIDKLSRLGYQVVRQTGSHIRLTSTLEGSEHHLTIPNHSPLRVGTLNNIIQDIANHHKVTKNELLKRLFS